METSTAWFQAAGIKTVAVMGLGLFCYCCIILGSYLFLHPPVVRISSESRRFFSRVCAGSWATLLCYWAAMGCPAAIPTRPWPLVVAAFTVACNYVAYLCEAPGIPRSRIAGHVQTAGPQPSCSTNVSLVIARARVTAASAAQSYGLTGTQRRISPDWPEHNVSGPYQRLHVVPTSPSPVFPVQLFACTDHVYLPRNAELSMACLKELCDMCRSVPQQDRFVDQSTQTTPPFEGFHDQASAVDHFLNASLLDRLNINVAGLLGGQSPLSQPCANNMRSPLRGDLHVLRLIQKNQAGALPAKQSWL
jgi:hypothetical protein